MNKKEINKPTLSDVAKEAGVSIMTVSNVVNGRVELVRAETRQRVLETVHKLGYRPHSHARGLRLSRSSVIGMLVVMRQSDFLAAPWMSRMVAGLSNALNEQGYGLLLHSQSPDALDESVLLKWAHSDGLIAILSGPDREREDIWKKLVRMNQPVIALQETIVPRSGEDLAIVRQDDFDGAEKIATHLLARGARRLVFLEPDFSWPNMAERISAISAQVRKTRGASLKVVKCRDESYASVEASVLAELEASGLPDAFLAANEPIALAALDTIEGKGYRVPEDTMLTGFNAFDLWFFARKRITTISFPAYEIGVRAGQTMLARLRSGRFPRKVEVFPAEFVQGDTTTRNPRRGRVTTLSKTN
jgi:LacI family transcriptional regulator